MTVQIGGPRRAAPGADCLTWEGLTMGLRQANGVKAFEAVDQIENALNALAIKIMADPRRVQAVQAGCPSYFADIQRRGQAGTAARQVPDPAHDPALLEGWLKTLPDELLSGLEKAAKAEIAARKKAKTKKK